ncbi:MAG: CRTAC1 family protein [Deltaproteobacteria bacterium]
MAPGDWFEDVTEQTGISFTYGNGEDAGRRYILESLGGGVALFDYDNDGDLDVFCTGGGHISPSDPVVIRGRPPALYRNDGSWNFVDVTQEAGLLRALDYSHGCGVADFDRDGWLDLFVCCYGRSRLFRNTRDGGFVDISQPAEINFTGWSTSVAWPDVDGDGWPDLYVTRYADWGPDRDQPCWNSRGQRDVCSPTVYRGEPDKLFRNRGDGRFEEITREAGLSGAGKGLGVAAADLDGDGYVDLYVARDEVEKDLYRGGPALPLMEIARNAGVAASEFGVPEGSMGVDVGDFDGDGRPDIWVTNFENEDNALYRNLGDGGFVYATVSAGLAGQSRRYVGFGTALADFDGDGWLDIFVVNGHVFVHGNQSPYRQPAQLFRNVAGSEGGRRFDNVSDRGGSYFRSPHVGRGVAVGDLDDDGALDVVISHQNERLTVLRNCQPPPHFLRVLLRGIRCHPQAVGARVSIDRGERALVRFVTSGAGYFSHFDQRILFPIPTDAALDVTVHWPGGGREVFPALGVDQTHELVEGNGINRGSH